MGCKNENVKRQKEIGANGRRKKMKEKCRAEAENTSSTRRNTKTGEERKGVVDEGREDATINNTREGANGDQSGRKRNLQGTEQVDKGERGDRSGRTSKNPRPIARYRASKTEVDSDPRGARVRRKTTGGCTTRSEPRSARPKDGGERGCKQEGKEDMPKNVTETWGKSRSNENKT